jgi:PPOX class probable F420-dependent enzyme
VLDDRIKALTDGPNFATFTTLLADGSPMTHEMWVGADGDHVLINTEVHRAKYRAVQRDPRVAVTIWDREDPYHFGEVRGEVVETVTGPAARAHIDELSMKYNGHEYRNQIQSERLIVRIKPLHQRLRTP